MLRRALRLSVILVVLVCALPGPARAAEACARTVIVTMPGVIWSDIEREKPPNILETARQGATGSISVRTDSSITSYGDGFLTLGAGTRAEAGDVRAAIERVEHLGSGPISFAYETEVARFDELTRSAASSSYEPQLGALATALALRDDIVVFALGNADLGVVDEGGEPGRWPLFAAMNENGLVERSVVDSDLLVADASAPFGVRTDPDRIRRSVNEALDDPCSMIVVDGGDLIRREEAIVRGDPSVPFREPLLALDALVGSVRARLDPTTDMLLLVSPTSPATDPVPHLGVAIAQGPGFGPGDALTSGSTGASGIVALTDVAPTVLLHQGVARPASMVGRPWFPQNGGDDRIGDAVDLDEEARFAHRAQPIVSGAFGVADLLLVIGAFWFFRRRRRPEDRASSGRLLEWAALAALSFPFVAFASTPLPADDLGPGLYGATLVALTLLVGGVVTRLGRSGLEGVLIICGATIALLAADLLTGARLQLTGVWGNDAILGGRFAGLGNIGFAVLGSCSITAAALLVHLRRSKAGIRAAGSVLLAAVIIDGMPFLGRDVGGVLALVPALLLTGVLLTGRKVTLRSILLAVLIAGAALSVFAAIDLARPEEQETHLARLVDEIRQEGAGVFTDAIDRKIDANLGVFGENPASFLIPPIWAVFAWLVLRGKGRWQILRARHPELHAALVGGLSLALFGGVVNDSGIVVVAVVMSVLAPVSVLMLLEGERHGEAA